MTGPAYPAARTVAARVQPHLATRRAGAVGRGIENLAPDPDPAVIEAVINVAFWASLRREEIYSPTVSLAWLPPEMAEHPLRFERPLPLVPDSLVRLAPAVERPGIHLGLWANGGGDIMIWGVCRELPALCFVLEVSAPGLLVIKHSREEESFKFVNLAVLEGDQIKALDLSGTRLTDCPPLVASLLGFGTLQPAAGSTHVMMELAASMRAHRRGGSLLVVPSGSDAWRESIIQPILYSISPPFCELAALLSQPSRDASSELWQEELRRVVASIAGHTAVDGATVMNDRYELLAFGVKIVRRDALPLAEEVIVTEPIEGATPSIVTPTQLGGTRHLSAAQFSQDQVDSIAMVASQDGRFTIFAWSECEQKVHAHRIETLLL